MTITVTGHSDDTICVSGDIYEEFEAYGDNAGQLLAFSDGSVLRVVFGDKGVWRISPVVGCVGVRIDQAPEDDDENYSDKATLGDGITWVVFGTGIARRQP